MNKNMKTLTEAPAMLRAAVLMLQADASEKMLKTLESLANLLEKDRWLTSKEAAELLGVSSPNTIKNWLEGGHFPSARKTPGGHWRFALTEVIKTKAEMQTLRERNRQGDSEIPDFGDNGPEIPTL